MSMRPLTFVVAALLGVSAAVLVACGAGDRSELIPPRSADRLNSALSDVRTAVEDGNCQAAERALARARGALLNLPQAVDDRLVARLREGISNLDRIAARECEQQDTQTTTVPTTETTTPETTPTETTTPETTPTETTPTDTTTTDTSPTETTTTPAPEPTPPADDAGGGTSPEP